MRSNFYTKALNVLGSFKKSFLVAFFSVVAMSASFAQTPATGLNFDGSNDYVNIPVAPSLNISSSLTLEAWINPQKATGTQNVICKAAGASLNTGYIFPRTSDGWKTTEFLLYINGYGYQTLKVNFGQDKLFTWHHLAATYDGFYMNIYIDGVLAGTKQFAGVIAVNNNALRLGGHDGFTEYYKGDVDEVRVWNRSLSVCEINNNISCELLGSQSGLVAYYKFNQGNVGDNNSAINTLTDASGNVTPNTGTLVNFALTGATSNWDAGIVTGTCSAFTPVNATATSEKSVVVYGSPLQLYASGGTAYSWTGPNGFISTDQNPLIQSAALANSGTYTVVVSKNGCSASASVTVTVADFGGALNFDGTNDDIAVPNSPSLSPANNISIETWINPTNNSPTTQNVISKSSRLVSTGYIFPRTDDGWRTFSFWLNIGGQWKVVSANYPSLNTWHHVAATYDGFFMKIYLDGVLKGTLAVSGQITTNTNTLNFGQQSGATEFYKGSIDETRIWSRALTQCEIQNNLTCELYGGDNSLALQVGLSAYYRFNQGLINVDNSSVNVLVDSSGNNNNGLMDGFALNGNSSNWIMGVVSGSCTQFVNSSATASSNGPNVEVGKTVNLFASGGTSYSWTGPNSFTSVLQNPTIPNATEAATGTYTVSVSGGGCTSVASVNVTVAFIAGALNLDGVNDRVIIPNSSSINISKNITIESWIFPTNGSNLIQDVLSKSTRNENSGYIFPRTDDGWQSFVFYLHLGGSTFEKISAPYPSLNEWHHVAATYDGFYIRLYLDGALVKSKQVEGDIKVNSNDLVIGQQPGFGEFYSGSVDETKIWNRALNQCEIITDMNCELAPSQKNGLVAYFKYNQGFLGANNSTETSLNDESGNANNGVLTDFALQGSTSNWSAFKVAGTCIPESIPNVTASSNASTLGVGSTVMFFANGGVGNYNWDGPNGFASNQQNPKITNAQPSVSGIYTVTAQFVKCVVTASTKLTVSYLDPIATSGPTTICPSSNVVLTMPNTGTSYQWYRDEEAIIGATAKDYNATTSGSYNVSVFDGTNYLLSSPISVTVIDNQAPIPDTQILPALQLVSPTVLTVIPTATDNCRGVINGVPNRSLTFDVPGTYTITWTYDDQNGQIVTQTQDVEVIKGPDLIPPVLTSVPANITLQSTAATACGAIYSFTATATDDSGDPVTINYSTPSGSVFPVGLNTVTVTATDASNNVTTASFTVNVLPTVVTPIIGLTNVCVGNTTTLSTLTSGISWNSSNSNVATVDNNGIVTGVSAGSAVISYQDACGISTSVTITVNAIPSTPVINVVNNCGTSVLSTNAGGSLLWNNGSTLSFITVPVGTYSVTSTINGCTSDVATVLAVPTVVPLAPIVTVSDNCGTSTLTTLALGSILWSTGETTSSITVPAGNYTVTAILNGCTSSPTSVTAAPTAIPSTPVVAVSNNCGSSVISTNAAGTLLWSNGSILSSISVPSGSYSVTTTVNGCTSSPATVTAAPKVIPATPVIDVVNNCGTSVLSTNAAGSLLWSNGSTLSSITVPVGSYSVTTTVNGCTSNVATALAAPTVVPLAPIVTVSNNCGTSTLTTLALGSILWSTGETTSSITVTAAGNYTVTATLNGCTSAPTSVTASPIVVPAAPVVSVSNNCGSSVISTNAAGTLLWSNGSILSSISVSSGSYSVTTTVNGCTSAPTTVTAAPKVIPATPVIDVVNNCGTSVLSTNAAGSLLWNNGSTSSSITVPVGTYSVTATVNGCTSNVATALAAPTVAPLAPIVSVTNNCGTSTLSTLALGSILWSTGETTSSITVTAAGNYTVTVTLNGCTSAPATVTAAPKAIPATPIINVSNNCGTSVLNTTATGSLLWSNNATSSSITVPSGTYSVTTTANGCTSLAGSGTASPTAIPSTPVVSVINNCGTSILSTSSNGTYLWSNGAITSSITVTAGTYTVTTYSNGCTSQAGSGTAAPTAIPSAPVVSVVNNCGTSVLSTSATGTLSWSNGAITPSITVAAGTYTVTTNVNGCTSLAGSGTAAPKAIPSAPVVSVVNNCGTSVLSTSATGTLSWSNGAITPTITVTAGTYTVTTNVSGCNSLAGSGIAAPTAIPSAPVVSVVNNCGTSTLSTSATGTLSWSNGAITPSITVTAGTYTVTTSSNGCTSLAGSGTAAPTAIPSAPVVSVVNNCGTSTLSTSATGTLSWSNGAITPSITVTAGTYTVTTSSNGCTSLAGSATAAPKAIPATPVITVVNGCGTSALSTASVGTYLWSNSATTASTTVSTSGNYSVTVSDVNGCSSTSASTAVTINAVPVVSPITGSTTVNTGSTAQLADVTAGGVWSSSNTAVATVSATGLVAGVSAGTVVITYKVTSSAGCATSVTTTITVGTSCVTPVATITASSPNAFCNKLTLTANSSTSVNLSYKWLSGSTVVGTTQQLPLGQANADGIYTLIVSSGACTSAPVTYNFQKQNLISSYTILATTQVQLGVNNTVASGSIGVTSAWGYVGLSSNTYINAPGSFVKSRFISGWGYNINVSNPIFTPATNVPFPTMINNTVSKTSNLPDVNVKEKTTVTLNGNYDDITIGKGATVTLTGSIFGDIIVQQGAKVTFTNSTVNISSLKVNKGPRYGYTYVRFSQDANVLISASVTISSNVFINPDNNNVTFYLGDSSPDLEKFNVNGGDTKINANVYVPNGILKVTGGYRYGDYGGGTGDCDRDDDDPKYYGQGDANLYMTGVFIADQVVGYGKNVIWNSFDCNAAPVPVTATSTPVVVAQTSVTTQEKSTVETVATTEEELKVTVMPNPSTTHFTLKLESKYVTPVNLRVMDANGRVVDAKSNIGSNSTFQIGDNYSSGTYYAEMTQGAKRKVVQLIKVRG